jgi:hypothetical protein
MNNLIFQCETSVDLSELAGEIHDYQITHSSISDLLLTTEMINVLLKKLTGCVAATETDLNAYPVGYNTALLFDLDGEPVT